MTKENRIFTGFGYSYLRNLAGSNPPQLIWIVLFASFRVPAAPLPRGAQPVAGKPREGGSETPLGSSIIQKSIIKVY